MSMTSYRSEDHERELAARLESYATSKGYELVCGPLAVVEDVRQEITSRRARGELDARFAEMDLSWFQWPQEGLIEDARSLVLLAIPRPAHTVVVQVDGDAIEVVLPPTYVRFRATTKRVLTEVSDLLSDTPCSWQLLRAPLKAIASRLGLIEYGRNNIGYHPALGSALQLVGLVTDADLESTEPVAGPRMMAACEDCEVCRSVCPTGAIDDERFLLRAERCLTHLNEHTGEWPAWLAGTAHNSMIGCILCQEACPQNADLLCRESSGVTLDEEEVRCMVDGAIESAEPAAVSVRAKLDGLGYSENLAILGRNLRALLD